ncbi:complement component C7 [Clinocottus analis]|uniref:complement component C7 n=1 Tax=Clinocottus analis TaxID=304258 RepID=UPI0035C1E50D
MKSITQLSSAALPWLLFLFTSKGFCNQRVDCPWEPYGDWSECDSCTKLQTRSRSLSPYAQIEESACDGERTETRTCNTRHVCPTEPGCGDRFRCLSGKCISRSLMCNGDPDCEGDEYDERFCDVVKHIVCLKSVRPPNIELLGLGFDVVSGQRRGPVIDTKSFGGQCRVIYSGVHSALYRLPLSTVRYSSMDTPQNDFSDDIYTSKWHYAKDIVNRQKVTGTTTGYDNYDFDEAQDSTQTQKLLVLKSDIEVAQFQSNSHQYLLLSEALWKALVKLPLVYDYAAYRTVLQRFGTHYLSEGKLGGSFKVVAKIDEETEHAAVNTSNDGCEKTERWLLIFPIKHVDCKRAQHDATSHRDTSRSNNVKKVNAQGGDVQHIAALASVRLSDPDRNWEMYSNWAESVKLFPDVTNQTLRPLHELVKEVQCAGLKRLHLRRATERYLSESDTCHCRPCGNNGLLVMAGDECKCVCKPGTSGPACEQGSEAQGQPGVVRGGWACWSDWSVCSGVRRTRTRSCSNPTPQNGGEQCVGEPSEASDCEDRELQKLKTTEPHCFDRTLSAGLMCGNPPVLINGRVLDPQYIYLVGSKVEYTCTLGFHLVGNSIAECTADETWSALPGLCTVSRCKKQFLPDDVIASPLQWAYGIGDTVTLSCPAGRQLLGEPTIKCDFNLHFTPDPADIKCSPVSTREQRSLPAVQCKPWEKSSRGKCVCKMPFECSSSLEVCATDPVNRNSVLVSVCKLHALQCTGKKRMLAEQSTCKWPERHATGCTNCRMWETCDDRTDECRCKDSADCLTPGFNVCVKVGEEATAAPQTMSECETGLRQCKGEKVSVVSILPCTAEDAASTT